METRPMTEMEERLMTRFMQADGERNEANRERDEARAERDDAKEWVHHATRMANERDEARAERDALDKALRAPTQGTLMFRPPSIDKHLADFERFFGDDEWQFGTGVDFNAMRAVRGLRQYITKLERQANVLRHTIAELDERSE